MYWWYSESSCHTIVVATSRSSFAKPKINRGSIGEKSTMHSAMTNGRAYEAQNPDARACWTHVQQYLSQKLLSIATHHATWHETHPTVSFSKSVTWQILCHSDAHKWVSLRVSADTHSATLRHTFPQADLAAFARRRNEVHMRGGMRCGSGNTCQAP